MNRGEDRAADPAPRSLGTVLLGHASQQHCAASVLGTASAACFYQPCREQAGPQGTRRNLGGPAPSGRSGSVGWTVSDLPEVRCERHK